MKIVGFEFNTAFVASKDDSYHPSEITQINDFDYGHQVEPPRTSHTRKSILIKKNGVKSPGIKERKQSTTCEKVIFTPLT